MTLREVNSSRWFWIGLLLSYPLVLALTMYKDWYMTRQAPEPLFYLTVPTIGILGSCLAVVITNMVAKRNIAVLDVAKIVFLSEYLFQLWEILAKLVYHWIWRYPGMLWFLVFPVNLWFVAFLFRRVNRTSWRYGLLLSVVAAFAGMLFGLGWMSLTGIDTAGS